MAKALLLINLGTPVSPEPEDVKIYLKEFLMDPHVIDIPFWKRWILVNGIIAPFRSKRSSKAYKKVWMEDGSPLMVYSQGLKKKVANLLKEGWTVDLAMRYGEPSICERLDALQALGMTEIYIVPLYPQYADSSTGTAIDEVGQWLLQQEEKNEGSEVEVDIPSIEVLQDFPAYEPFLESFVQKYRETVTEEVDHTLISFHSLPERHLVKEYEGCAQCLKNSECPANYRETRPQCYRAQCYETARALASKLELKSYSVSFQSKLGREPWLTPATDQELLRLPANGVKRLAILCPSFVADCLETLEEIGIEGRKEFMEAGGTTYIRVPCPNDSDPFAEAMKALAEAWAQGACPERTIKMH